VHLRRIYFLIIFILLVSNFVALAQTEDENTSLPYQVNPQQLDPYSEQKPSSNIEREELRQLRRDVKRLQTEREILKKAAVGSTGQCNAWFNVSAGVRKSKVLRGRALSCRATRLRSACEC
jgi:hypothetical protein